MTDTYNILVADDEPNMRMFLTEALSTQGYSITTVENGEEAVDKVKSSEFACVLLDMRMPKMDGIRALEEISRLRPDIPVIMMTAYGSREVALDAMRIGAYDYFNKPFDLNEMRVVVKRALEKRKLEDEISQLKDKLREKHHFKEVIGQSTEMQDVFTLVTKVMNSDITVIIYGESGTGKEVIASLIQHNSNRKDGPFIKVNCAAIPENLLESELFGYEKGAFTGAVGRKIGKFEQASGGTIFLDEIGDMTLAMQAKILRVLEEREIERVGGNQTIKVDIRIIAATNKDLSVAVREKLFREDLYFRLNVMPVFMPALRNRKGDIMPLVEHFIEKSNKKYNRSVRGISQSVYSAFLTYQWPGNVRELENTIERAVLLSTGDVVSNDCLPPNILRPADSDTEMPSEGSLLEIVDSIAAVAERQIIINALDHTDWSRKKTAENLKISRKSLHNKMKKYGLFDMKKDGSLPPEDDFDEDEE